MGITLKLESAVELGFWGSTKRLDMLCMALDPDMLSMLLMPKLGAGYLIKLVLCLFLGTFVG
jgi:hypothetical protein